MTAAGYRSAEAQVHHLTSPLRAHGRKVGDADVINLWAGGTRWRRGTPPPRWWRSWTAGGAKHWRLMARAKVGNSYVPVTDYSNIYKVLVSFDREDNP
jgi:hypothetical protein